MLKVCEKQCDQCLFSKNRIVSSKRMSDILQSCVLKDSHFNCHKGTIVDETIVCKGFYDNYSSNLIRIMGRLNGLQFVNPETLQSL